MAEGEGLEPPRAYARRISSAVHYHSANPPVFTLLIFFHKFHLIFFWYEKKINDLQNSQSIYEKNGEKPVLLPQGGGAPQSKTFPDKGPNDRQNNPEWVDSQNVP